MKKLKDTTVTFRDSCKTYALKRVGLENLINWSNDTPTLIDLCESAIFDKIKNPEKGCILVWLDKTDDSSTGFYSNHRITENGQIVSIRRYHYGHCGVYEGDDLVSDLTFTDGRIYSLRIRVYSELPKPDFILKKL